MPTSRLCFLGQRITQDTVANYVLEGNLHGPHNQSDYLINFQKGMFTSPEPKALGELRGLAASVVLLSSVCRSSAHSYDFSKISEAI